MFKKFDEIVDEIKLLEPEDKAYLRDLIDKLLIEDKRKLIKKHASESLEEYKQGKIKFGTVSEIKKDLYD